MVSEQKPAINSKLWSHHPGLTLDLQRRQTTDGQDIAQCGDVGVRGVDTNLLGY